MPVMLAPTATDQTEFFVACGTRALDRVEDVLAETTSALTANRGRRPRLEALESACRALARLQAELMDLHAGVEDEQAMLRATFSELFAQVRGHQARIMGHSPHRLDVRPSSDPRLSRVALAAAGLSSPAAVVSVGPLNSGFMWSNRRRAGFR